MPQITGTYAMADWKEEPVLDGDTDRKITRVHANGAWQGPLAGTAETFYLISYLDKTGGPFSGFLRFAGSWGDVKGGFTIAETGTADAAAATSDWRIVTGSGTGGFKGIAGTGGFRASDGLTFGFTLDFTLPTPS
jgi:Protein of unknown function (DUF3224)